MRLIRIHRTDMPAPDGTVRSSAYYSILLEEWPGVRGHLEERLRTHRY